MSRSLIIPAIGLTIIEAAKLSPLVKQFITDWLPTIDVTDIQVRSYGQNDTILVVQYLNQTVEVDEEIYAFLISELRYLSAFAGFYMIGTDPLDAYLADMQKLTVLRFQEYVLAVEPVDLSNLKIRLIEDGYRYIRHDYVNLTHIDAQLVWQKDGERIYKLSANSALQYPDPNLEYLHQLNCRAYGLI